MSSNDYDIIIIGAGLSGFVTAYTISKLTSGQCPFKICILEGRDRCGGRLKPMQSLSGKSIDLGGMWVGPLQTYIGDLLQELAIPVYKQYLEGVNIHDDSRRLHRYTGTIPNISLFSLLDTHLLLGRMDKLVRSIDVEDVSSTKHAREYDTISLYEYGRRHCWTNQAQSLLSVATRMILGYETDQVSLLYFLYYCRTAGGTRPLVDSDGGGQDSRMKGGTAALLHALRDSIERSNCDLTVITGRPVVSVDYSSHPCVAICSDNSSFTSKRIVMCCPPSALSRISFSPTPSPWKLSLWKRSISGCLTKVVVVYNSAFWREAGFSGSAVCEHPSLTRPLSGVFDYCDDSGDNPALCGFISGDVGVRFASLSEGQQRTAVLGHLAHLFGSMAENEENLIEFHIMDWLHDPDGSRFGGGCPVDTPGLGYFREHSSQLRTPLFRDPTALEDVVFFAGTETALKWVGYMDGAVESGLRVGEEVVKSLERDEM